MPTKPPAPTPAEWREGKKRAIALLRDLEEHKVDDMDLEDDCRDGRPQQNVVYPHLVRVMATHNSGVLQAFSSVLTHYVGNAARAGVPDIEPTSRRMRKPIAQCWPQISRAAP